MRISIALALSAPLVFAASNALAADAPSPAAPATTTTTTATTTTTTTEPAPAPATTTTATAPATSTDGTVQVHLDTPLKVGLERRSSPSAAWEHACESPCDTRLNVGDEYRIVGTNLNPSNAFRLDGARGDRVVLTVTPGEHKKEVIGTWLLIGGGVLLVAGIVVIAVTAHPSSTFSADGETHNGSTNGIFAGTALILGGITSGIFGAAWMIDNSRSHVGGDIQRPPSGRGDLGPMLVGGLRTPAPVGPSFIFPIVNTTF